MDMVKGAVTKQVMGKIGGLLGTDEAKTNSAFETAAGSILGGLIKKTGNAQGARDIFDLTQKQDTGVLDKLGDLLGGGQATEQYQQQGSGLLEGIFGGEKEQTSMLGTLGKFLGFKGSVMGTLMKLVAPIVMGVIAKHVKAKALDAVGLGSFLGEQKKSLGGFMPASLTSDLGFGNLLGNVTGAAGDAGKAVAGAASSVGGAVSGAASNVGGAVSGAASSVGGAASSAGRGAANAAGDAASAGGGLVKLLLPLLLLGALIFGAWKLLPMLTGAAGDAANKAGSLVEGAKEGAGNLVDGVKGGMEGVKIPGLDMGSIEGFDMGSLGEAGPKLTEGFGGITSGFADLATTGEDGAKSLAEKITGFTGSIDGMGLDKLEGAGKTSATGLIGMFLDKIKGLMGSQSEGIQGILKPAVDGLMQKLGPMVGM